jgi:hypothetical protein
MTLDVKVDEAWRRFATLLAGSLLFIACTFLVVTLYFRSEVSTLQAQVSAGDRQTECRSRIASSAEVIRADRDSVGWQSLVDRFVSGQSGGLEDRSRQMADLNRRLLAATDLRAKAIELCAANPDFVPPT